MIRGGCSKVVPESAPGDPGGMEEYSEEFLIQFLLEKFLIPQKTFRN